MLIYTSQQCGYMCECVFFIVVYMCCIETTHTFFSFIVIHLTKFFITSWVNFHNFYVTKRSFVVFWFLNFLLWRYMWYFLVLYLSFFDVFLLLILFIFVQPSSLRLHSAKIKVWFCSFKEQVFGFINIFAIISNIYSHSFLLPIVYCFLSFLLTLNNNF